MEQFVIALLVKSKCLVSKIHIPKVTCTYFTECEETQYETDLSQAELRRDSLIFERLKDISQPVANLIGKHKELWDYEYVISFAVKLCLGKKTLSTCTLVVDKFNFLVKSMNVMNI